MAPYGLYGVYPWNRGLHADCRLEAICAYPRGGPKPAKRVQNRMRIWRVPDTIRRDPVSRGLEDLNEGSKWPKSAHLDLLNTW